MSREFMTVNCNTDELYNVVQRGILCSAFSCGCRQLPASPGSAPGNVGLAAGKAPGCVSSVFPLEGKRKRLKSQLWKGEMKKKGEKERE